MVVINGKTYESLNILVTGGQGFVGHNLIKQLIVKYAHEVDNLNIVCYDNWSTKVDRPFIGGVTYISPKYGSQFTMDEIGSINENLFNNPIMEQVFPEGIDIIFHFGEYSRVVPSFKNTEKLFRSNMQNTFQVLEYLREHPSTLLVYSGSSTKFDENGNFSEDAIRMSPYALFKSHAIDMIKAYSVWYGITYNIAYFYNVYGDDDVETGEYATVVGIFKHHYRKGLPLPVRGTGTMRRDFTHIDDICSGLIAMISKNYLAWNSEYKLGTGRSYSIIELASWFTGATIQLIPNERGERKDGKAINGDSPEGWEPTKSIQDYIKGWIESGCR